MSFTSIDHSTPPTVNVKIENLGPIADLIEAASAKTASRAPQDDNFIIDQLLSVHAQIKDLQLQRVTSEPPVINVTPSLPSFDYEWMERQIAFFRDAIEVDVAARENQLAAAHEFLKQQEITINLLKEQREQGITIIHKEKDDPPNTLHDQVVIICTVLGTTSLCTIALLLVLQYLYNY